MNIPRLIVLIFTCAVITSCASKGFNRDSIQSQLREGKPQFDDKEIKEAYNKKPNLPKPFKLAIYFQPPPQRFAPVVWRWSEEDKATFDDITSGLKSQGHVSETFPILDSTIMGSDLHAIRLAAAKHGADALMIVTGATQMDKYLNGAGYTYFLILPTLFVKGSVVDTLFVTSATVWDVKNEYLYLTNEAEATSQDTYIAAFGKRDIELVNDAKAKALAKLKEQLKVSLAGTKL